MSRPTGHDGQHQNTEGALNGQFQKAPAGGLPGGGPGDLDY
jgi:hypothetical protein